MSVSVLTVAAIMLALGIGAQILAKRLKIPSALFLILIGVGLGPTGVGLVTVGTFGDGLSTIVGLSVAVIVFDGAFQLRREKLRLAPKTITGLTTIGAAVMFLGTAGAVRLFLDTDWGVSFLIGGLLIATGPTVITPIMDVISVREHLETTFEAEGIFNDVTAAILAIVVYESPVVESTPTALPGGFPVRLAIGVGVGVAIAVGVRSLLLTLDIPAGDWPDRS